MDWILFDSLVVLAVLTILLFGVWTTWLRSCHLDLHSIPTVGPTSPLLSYFGAIRLLFDSERMLQEGYEKHRHGLFKVADFTSWTVMVSGPQLISDVRKAPADVLEFEAAIDDAVHALGPSIRRSQFHVPLIRIQLTRETNPSFYDIRDEITTGFTDLIPATTKWSRTPAFDVILEVVCRTTHRMFVGLPLCRNSNYIATSKKFTMDISHSVTLVRLFPEPLKWFVGRPFVNVPATLKIYEDHLRPLVEERQKNIKLYGRDYAGKPQDLLSWLIDEVDGQTDKEKLTHLAFHMLIVNFGANSTIAMKSFVQALYHLASHPEYVGPLREEVESITTNEGWTKDAMRSLHRLENFLKESQRVSGLAAVSSFRRVRKPFVFSNGVRIPAGVTIGVATWPTHFDDEVYPNAHTFDASRYKDDESRIVTPSDEFLAFGVGRFMCPGRFFGVLILQVMMAHVLMNYDVRLETEGERPKDSWFSTEFIPDTSAGVLFRKRAI